MDGRLKLLLDNLRVFGISTLIIPHNNLEGLAFQSTGDESNSTVRYINLWGNSDDPNMLFVLLHEFAHHICDHLSVISSDPEWVHEYEANMIALDAISTYPELYPEALRMSREHIRWIMQEYIDADCWMHVDLKISDWAGCNVPYELREMLSA